MTEFSFNASGWMQVFQLGVVKGLQDSIELDDVNAVGTSAGAAAAAALITQFPADAAARKVYRAQVRSRNDVTCMVPVMKEAIHDMVPSDAAQKCDGRLGIVCTELRGFRAKTIEFGRFDCRDDVVELLCATAHVPVLGGWFPYPFRSEWLYDGLFTETHPRAGNRDCFKVSWTPHCDCGCTTGDNLRVFCPQVQLPLWWCVFPPDESTLRLIFWHGYTQAKQGLERDDFPRHLFTFKSSTFVPRWFANTVRHELQTRIDDATPPGVLQLLGMMLRLLFRCIS